MTQKNTDRKVLNWAGREITPVFLLLATKYPSQSIQKPALDAGNQTTYFVVMLICRMFKKRTWMNCRLVSGLWWAEPCAQRCAELNECTAVVTERRNRNQQREKEIRNDPQSHLWNKNLTNADAEHFCIPKTVFWNNYFLMDHLLPKTIQFCNWVGIFTVEKTLKDALPEPWHALAFKANTLGGCIDVGLWLHN